jgi:hypothetical protein
MTWSRRTKGLGSADLSKMRSASGILLGLPFGPGLTSFPEAQPKRWWEYSSNYCACFGSMELDANISSFFGDSLFPVVMHQDPRYFRSGHGSFGARLFYNVSRVFVTHSDSGRRVFDSSALSGTVLAAAASNLHYPKRDRGFSPSLDRAGTDLGDTAMFNVAAEFWPDISNKLRHVF